MAAINFPAAPELNATFEANGVIYKWNGSYWEANVANSTFDDTYVEINGDNMVGNLTLGTDKVLLNAADGSARLAGGKIVVSKDGGAEFEAKIKTASTLDTDADTTVVTKDYVKSNAGGLDLQAVTDAGNTTTNGANFGAPLGVGTDSPDRVLHVVQSGGSSNCEIRLENPSGEGRNLAFAGAGSQTRIIQSTGKSDGNALAFLTGAREDVRFDVNGNVGIGDLNPSQKLSIRSDGSQLRLSNTGGNTEKYLDFYSTGAFSFFTSKNLDDAGGFVFRGRDSSDYTDYVRIDSIGRVLIGTNQSRQPVNFSHLCQIEGIASTTSSASITRADTTIGGTLTLAKANGGIGAFGAVTNGETLGQIIFNGANGTNRNNYSARIRAQAKETFTTATAAADLIFDTTPPGATAALQRLRIQADGCISLGNATAVNETLRLNMPISLNDANTNGFGLVLRTPVEGTGKYFYGILSRPNYSNGATYQTAYNFMAESAGSADNINVDRCYGFTASDQIAKGSIENQGFRSNLTAGDGKWNFYAVGDADNYFAGRVGISTVAPEEKLTVVDNNKNEAFSVTRGTSGASVNQKIILSTHSGGNTITSSHDDSNHKSLTFESLNQTTGAVKTVMQLGHSGRVGIGKVSPGAALDVNGDIKATIYVMEELPSIADAPTTPPTVRDTVVERIEETVSNLKDGGAA